MRRNIYFSTLLIRCSQQNNTTVHLQKNSLILLCVRLCKPLAHQEGWHHWVIDLYSIQHICSLLVIRYGIVMLFPKFAYANEHSILLLTENKPSPDFFNFWSASNWSTSINLWDIVSINCKHSPLCTVSVSFFVLIKFSYGN